MTSYKKISNGIVFRKGATRCVFLIGKFAIKVPRPYTIQYYYLSWTVFLGGLLANLQERKFWREMRHPLLARVIFSDPLGFLLVMERADYTICSRGRMCGKKNMYAFFDCCEKAGLPVDRNDGNIGAFGEKWKLINYGS